MSIARSVDAVGPTATRRPAPARRHGTAVAPGAAHDVLALQRQIGNATVSRMRAGLPGAADPAGPEGGPVSDATAARIGESRGRGSARDHGTKAKMEEGFGTSFDDVRVHTGREADALSRRLGARAFTAGSDVYFAGDAGPADHALLAHELTHVVQQRGAAPGGGPMRVGPAGDALERQADRAAAAVAGRGA